MPIDSITIRDARSEDGESIFQWTQNTFSWGDYIPRIWHEWQKAGSGRLLVAEAEGRIVGNLHVAFLGNREAWMEGMRVHPEFRKRGVATALDLAGQQAARAARCGVARLETSSRNLAAQAAVATYGYRRIVELIEFHAPALKAEPVKTRPAKTRDLSALESMWHGSQMCRAVRGLAIMLKGWRWGELTRSRLREQIKNERVWVTPASGEPKGFAILRRDEDGLEVSLVVGRAAAACDVLTDLRAVAAQRNEKEVYLSLAAGARAKVAAAASGYVPADHSMLLYECKL